MGHKCLSHKCLWTFPQKMNRRAHLALVSSNPQASSLSTAPVGMSLVIAKAVLKRDRHAIRPHLGDLAAREVNPRGSA